MRLIETDDLVSWAGRKDAESRFPYYVKELICAVVEPTQIRFPSGPAVWLPGFDGVVLNNATNRFVPQGLSVWELSTESAITTKANKDLNKRSKTSVEINHGKTTFVFVTPRIWTKKGDWVSKAKKKDSWKEVVALDGVDLCDWFELASAVSLKFWAAEMEKGPNDGLWSMEDAWNEWSGYSVPPASEELVLVGREAQAKELIDRLVDQPGAFTVRGDSPREAWGFALAALRRVLNEEDRMRFSSRTIVASDEKVAGRLRNRRNLIILLKEAREQVSGYLSSDGSHVIIPEGTDACSRTNVIELSRPPHTEFAGALERMGMLPEEAEKASRACGRSVTILQRQRPHANIKRPKWAEGRTVTNLLPALLSGRWNSRSEADREILRQLAGVTDYDSLEAQFQGFLLVDEAPLQKIGDMWSLTAPVDAFQLTARYLTNPYLNRFKEAFRSVFGRIDPKVEIPMDDWLQHDLKGDGSHSSWLRSGMAEILLLIAERGNGARLVCLDSPSQYADDVVRGLPNFDDDWRVLAGIRDQCARLMEAAPGPFLDSLERLLKNKPEDMRLLFREGRSVFGQALYTGLLWGLETLAWSPQYLPGVALILAQLVRLDPGGQISNRPINSLRKIFLWWHPGTNASFEERLAALDLVLSREPAVGWALLALLLPRETSSFSSPTAKPRWRDFGELPPDARTRAGRAKYGSEIVERALDQVGSDHSRWRVILESVPLIGTTLREKALSLLADIAAGETRPDMKAPLWEIVRDFVYRNRTFSDSHWSLKGDELNRLEAILEQLAPDDPVERNKWLFDEWLPELPSGTEDPRDRSPEVEALRRRAVRQILDKAGIQGLVRLGTTCKYPGHVAASAIGNTLDLEASRDLLGQALAASERGPILAGYVSGRAQEIFGQPWRDLVRELAEIGTWTPTVIACLLIQWPDDRRTWEDAAKLGESVRSEYWRRKQVISIEGSRDDQVYQVEQLIEVGRATAALDSIALEPTDVPSEYLLKIFDATLDELGAETTEEVRRIGLTSSDIRQFLDQVRNRQDIPRKALARREYQALPLLGLRDNRGLTLHDFMASDPGFFVEVLCDVFRPTTKDKGVEREPTETEVVRAQFGFRLLAGMHRIPGASETGGLDEAALLSWIEAVRLGAAKKDRAAIADVQIGQILAHAPEDPEDHAWPHSVVRNVIEVLCADDVESGVQTERRNMRGLYTKELYEGGSQERALASQCREWAKVARCKWPRMARVLELMAEDWDRDARREDQRAEQDKLD